jgi:hypothetical protein
MVGELSTCLRYVCHTALGGRVAAPTAKTTRNARDSRSVGPRASYISSVLSSAANQNERRAKQYAEKESCFHLKLVPCLIASLMLAFYLSPISEPLQKQALMPYFPDGYVKDPRGRASRTNQADARRGIMVRLGVP